MSSLTYRSPSAGTTFDIDDAEGIAAGPALGLRNARYDYALGRVRLRSCHPSARAEKVRAVFVTREAAEAFLTAAEADLALETPGTIEADGWQRAAYIVGSEPEWISPDHAASELEIALLGTEWTHDTVYTLWPLLHGEDGHGYLDLPYDLPYDLSATSAEQHIDVPGLVPCGIRLVIYGPATSPYVMVGKNRYQVMCDIPEGGYLDLDSAGMRAEVVAKDGTRTDVLGKAVRGDGEGSGTYCFERLQPGRHEVSWTGGFGIDIHVHEGRQTPPWI